MKKGREVSVTFVTNEAIHEINREYREKDQPTDVISFALWKKWVKVKSKLSMTDIPRILGDIIISTERTREQAENMVIHLSVN